MAERVLAADEERQELLLGRVRLVIDPEAIEEQLGFGRVVSDARAPGDGSDGNQEQPERQLLHGAIVRPAQKAVNGTLGRTVVADPAH